MLRAIVCLGFTTSALASEKLDVLANAAASFSATIKQQLQMVQSSPSLTEFAEKTIDYAVAKIAYLRGLTGGGARIDENSDRQGRAAS